MRLTIELAFYADDNRVESRSLSLSRHSCMRLQRSKAKEKSASGKAFNRREIVDLSSLFGVRVLADRLFNN